MPANETVTILKIYIFYDEDSKFLICIVSSGVPTLTYKNQPNLAPVKATPSTKIVINPNFS